MKNKQVVFHAAVLLGLASYLWLFYATRLPSLEGATGGVFRRVDFFTWVLLPDELAAQWCGSPPEFALLDRVPVLMIAAVILGWAFSLGWLLISLGGADRKLGWLERLVFSTAVGLNLVSTYVLLVGLIGLVRNVFVFVVPAVLTLGAAGWRWLRSKPSRPETQGGPSSSPKRPAPTQPRHTDGLSPKWLWLALPFVFVILWGGMLPPIEFDVREYHLQVPKEFLQQGRVGFLPHNVYGNMPMGTEMLSLLAMVIGRRCLGDWWLGALAGKTVIAAFAPLTALALLAAGRRFFSLTAAIVAAVLYISVPWAIWISTNGLVEGALACYLLLAAYALLLWRRAPPEKPVFAEHREKGGKEWPGSPSPSSPFLLLAGYMAGGAVSCKYPAVLFVVVPLTVWITVTHLFARRYVLDRRSKTEDRESKIEDRKSAHGAVPGAHGPLPARCGSLWKPLSLFLLAVVVGCGLWFGKNWVLTGNPTYPLLYDVFGGRSWTRQKDARWNRVHRPHDFSPGTLVRDLGRVAWRGERLSPLVVPLAVLAFLVPRRRRLWLALWAYFGFVIAAWWLLTHRLDRFWTPALPLVALLAGAAACWSRDRLWRGALIAVLIVGSVWNFLVASAAGPAKYNRYFISLERARRDPLRVDPWHRYFNRHVSGGRVLLVGDAEVFDLEVPIYYSTCFDDSLFEELVKDPATGGIRAAESVRASFRQHDVSYVYVHWGEINRYRSPGNYGFTDFVEPAVLEGLVAENILQPLPDIEGHPGRAYRVVQPGN